MIPVAALAAAKMMGAGGGGMMGAGGGAGMMGAFKGMLGGGGSLFGDDKTPLPQFGRANINYQAPPPSPAMMQPRQNAGGDFWGPVIQRLLQQYLASQRGGGTGLPAGDPKAAVPEAMPRSMGGYQ